MSADNYKRRLDRAVSEAESAVEHSSEEQLSVTTPVGAFAFKGNQLFAVLLLCLFGLFDGWIMYAHDSKASERDKITVEAIVMAKEFAKTASEKNDETLKAMIYVLSLTQEDRQKLNLLRPKSLTDMQR